MSELVCRACHIPLTQENGCFICLPIKPHLMPGDATEDENVPLAQLASETAKLLRNQLKQLTLLQKASNAYDSVLAAESRQHATTLAKLLDSSRKVIQDGADAVECMSFQEKAALFQEWFSSLPPAYRRKLFDQLAASVPNKVPTEDIHERNAN